MSCVSVCVFIILRRYRVAIGKLILRSGRANSCCRVPDVTSLNSFTMASAVATAADQLTASHPRARSSLVVVVVGSALSSHLVKKTYGYIHIHSIYVHRNKHSYIHAYIHICIEYKFLIIFLRLT